MALKITEKDARMNTETDSLAWALDLVRIYLEQGFKSATIEVVEGGYRISCRGKA